MSAEAELRQVIAELSLVSHVCAASLAPSRNGTPQSKDPTGGIDRQDDKEQGWPLKSAEHFRKRASKANIEKDLEAILTDARASLEAFRRMPAPTKQNEPEYGSPQWKRYIGESQESYRTLADRFNVSPQYIGEVRRRYLMAA